MPDKFKEHIVIISFALYWKRMGGHVHVRLFAGPAPGHRAKCGDLVFAQAEWPHFQAALIEGSKRLGYPIRVDEES